MELKTLLCNLGITKDWDKYAEVYAPAMEKYEKEGSWYLEEDFLRGCQQKYNMLGKYEEAALEAARQLREDEYLKRYLAIIHYIVHERPDAPALLGRIPLPPVKSEETRLKT